MVKSKENLLGAYSFLIGVILAVIFGVFKESLESAGVLFYSVLIIIGLIVGFMNVGDKNSSTFLFASLALVIVAAFGNQEPLKYVASNNTVVSALRNVLESLLVLFAPVTIVVALKTVFAMSKV